MSAVDQFKNTVHENRYCLLPAGRDLDAVDRARRGAVKELEAQGMSALEIAQTILEIETVSEPQLPQA